MVFSGAILEYICCLCCPMSCVVFIFVSVQCWCCVCLCLPMLYVVFLCHSMLCIVFVLCLSNIVYSVYRVLSTVVCSFCFVFRLFLMLWLVLCLKYCSLCCVGCYCKQCSISLLLEWN